MKEFSRKVAIVTIAILLLLMNVPPSIMWNDDVGNDVKAAAPSKPTGSSGSYKVDAEASKIDANPSVYWTQIDDLSFTAVSDGGTTPSKNSGNNEPVAKQVKNTLDLTSYTMPTNFKGSDGKNYARSDLTKVYLKNDSVRFKNAMSFKGINLTKVSDTKFAFLTETGSPNIPTKKEKYGVNSKGQPKYSVRYDTPIDIVWYGQIENQAEMRVVEDSTITIGATKQYKAQVRTKKGNAAWSAWKDVSAYDWKSDKSSVASVSSNGSVKGLANGQAKITATWKDNDFHLQASANVKVTAEDALTITGNLNACYKDGSTTLKAILYKTGGKSSDVTNTATWTSSDTSVATVSKGVVTFKKVGTTTITATAEGKKETVKVTVIDCTVTPPPDPEEPEPPVPDNDPPTVKIEGPLEVKLGETVCYTADASDPDGYITSYLWNEGNMITDDFKSSKMCGRFDEIGEHGITVIVEDNGDINGKNVKTANDQMIIKVVGPKPSAYITVGGTLKENRKITAKVADAYGGNPVLHEKVPIVKQTLTIEAVDKSNQNKLFIKENISGNIDTSKIVNFLGKFTGEVKLTSYVENIEGSSDTFETVIDLQPDLAPIVDFETPSLIYREAPNTDGEYASADIVLTDNSYSVDDGIQKRIWRLKYDSNNDGSFDDEEWQLISDANEERFIYNTKKVGKYLVELEVFEKFGQETIDEYVDQTFDKATTDLRHGNSDLIAMETKIFEVNNLAPVASIELEQEKKTVEVQYDVIDSPYSETQLRTMTPYLNQKLADYGLKANVSFAESSVEEIKVISSGTTFFLRDNGEVYVTASGLGLFGIPHTEGIFTPTNANLPYKVKGLEYGYMGTAIFLTQDGYVYGAGNNNEFQITVDEDMRRVSPPMKIEIPRTAPIKSVSVSSYSAYGGLLYLLENGEVYGSGWINGLNCNYVGRRDIVKAELPLKATEITHTGTTGYFLLEDGSVYEQGKGQYLAGCYHAKPAKVELPSKVRKMYPSDGFIHFIMEDGTVYAMGKNYEGQLGDGTRIDRKTPVKIEFPSSVKEVYAKPSQPYTNDGKTLFLLNNGLVYEINGNKPYLLNLPFKTKRIFNNYSNQHFLTEDGEVYARGVNSFGSLGDGTSISRPIPVKISLPGRVKNISLGTVSTFFILEDGSIYATGANGSGQLGDGTTINRATPVKINAFEATKTSSFTHKSDPTYMTTFSNKPMKVEEIKNRIGDNQGYFVGATTASNQSAVQTIVKDNGDKGKFIDIGSTYNDANLKAKIQELADYIIDTQKNNKVEVEFLLDESTSGINKAALEQKIANTLKPLINSKDNSIPFESRVTVLTNNYKFKDTYLDGKNRFVVAVKNNSLSADLEKHITATSLANNAHFVGIGASANKKILERIVAKSMKKGTYIDNSNIDAALTELSNYILNEVEISRGINEAFVTTDEQINFITNFDDFEKDSLYDEYWKFKHELDYFESETGLFPEHDTQIRTPILTFGQTGRYQPHYAAQDDPLRALDNDKVEYFKDYRKWSDEVNNLFVFVHKKPSSDFTFTVDKISGAFTVTSKAFDSDKKSIDVGLGAGLKYQQFSWKLKEENDWNEGLPKGNLEAGKSYEVRNTVVDFQNKESITTKTLSRNNLPPVAIFESDKLEYEEGENVQLTNSSYDPNGDDMTATWYIKNSNDDNTKYKEINTGTYQNGKGNQDWNTVIKNLKCSNKKSEEACSYTIKLFVKDKYGDSDETTRSIKVVSVEAIEVGIEAVEVYTAPSIKGLPTYIQLNEEVLVAKEEQAEDARNAFVQITVNKDGKYYMDNSFKVKELVEGVQFMIPPTDLQVDSAYDFEFEISSDDDSIVIDPGAEKISLNARTAEEKTISSKDIDLTYKGLVSVKRSINTDQVNTYEVIHLETAELKPTVTGLGHSLDQTFKYELPLNQHYSAEGLMNISSKLSFDEVLIDSNFDTADVVEGKAIVNTVNTDKVVETNAKKETITQTFSYPKVYVESVKGNLYSENQKSVNDSRIKHGLIDGGHKLYIPIWLDDIGKYDINYETTSEIGVNKVKFEVSQILDIEAYLFLHMNSSTKEKDKFLIEPVNKKNSFPNGKPVDWSDNDVEWIRN
ncbi:MAG TPA: hypothetical protein DG757_24420 [Bacillus sp. (in: Bacteria)]|nr:hypothetical protein [Bacillus sp. (in: firmicutes)]